MISLIRRRRLRSLNARTNSNVVLLFNVKQVITERAYMFWIMYPTNPFHVIADAMTYIYATSKMCSVDPQPTGWICIRLTIVLLRRSSVDNVTKRQNTTEPSNAVIYIGAPQLSPRFLPKLEVEWCHFSRRIHP